MKLELTSSYWKIKDRYILKDLERVLLETGLSEGTYTLVDSKTACQEWKGEKSENV